MIHDLVIDRQLPTNDEREVVSDFNEPGMQALERGELRGDACAEGAELVWGFDVTEEMLDTDFFGFFRFNG
jgi:hypothetical protein